MTLKAASLLAAFGLTLACCGRSRPHAPAPPPAPQRAAPVAGDACRKTGCGGQVCADRDVITTCAWRPEHDCYRAARCERQPEGGCGFTPDPALDRCLEQARAQAPGTVPVQ
jgi:hypothetical protein